MNSHWPAAGEVHTIAAVVDSDADAVGAVEIAADVAAATKAGDAAAEA